MTTDKKKILVVDDVDDVRDALVSVLEDFDYQIFAASNGQEALDTLQNEAIDLMITDILMPQMDGLELVTAAQKECPGLKIILMSGGGRFIGSEGGYDYLGKSKKLTGVPHVIKKPVKAEELMSTIEEVLA